MFKKMKLAQSPACNCGLEDQTPTSTDSKNKYVANSSLATRQTLRQQGGSGEDSHIHLADWTLSVAAMEKKKTELRTQGEQTFSF